MKKSTKFLLWIVAVIAIVVLSYRWIYPSYTWHQKLTVEVETPEGVKSGSAIVGINVKFGPSGLGDISGLTQGWHGEATIVDLDNGRYLFALLGHPIYMAQGTFVKKVSNDPNYKITDVKEFYPKMQRIEGPVTVPRHRYFPLLVTFTDINDPASVVRIDPYDLESHFGAGVKLKAVTLEITTEPVTQDGVEQVLGWLDDPKVMKNPGWSKLPLESRRAIGALKSYFPSIKGE